MDIILYKILCFYLTRFFPRYDGIFLKKSIQFIRSFISREKKRKKNDKKKKEKEISKSVKLTISKNLILHKIRIPHVNFENGISPTRLNGVAMHKFGCYLIYHVGGNQFAV